MKTASEKEFDGMNKLQSIAVAIEQFSNDIIVPTLTSSGVGEVQCPSNIPAEITQFHKQRDDRVFVGALLSLREVLILNSKVIFSLDDFSHDNDGIERPIPTNSMAEERNFRAYLLSTSLILSALQVLEPNQQEYHYLNNSLMQKRNTTLLMTNLHLV